jgi:glycolate oxidase
LNDAGGPNAVAEVGKTAAQLLETLSRLLGSRLHAGAEDQLVYECDAAALYKQRPLAIAFPETSEEVVAIVRACAAAGVPFTARGAGTGLSGGAEPAAGGVLVATTRMRRILHVDLDDRYAIVQPGVVNALLTREVAAAGFHYAPDPSSQQACTIGGNVAENSGGPHCLKHGMTTRHILGLTVVLPDGRVAKLGGPVPGAPGYDLVGLFVGSEGTLGIATEIVVRLEPQPQEVRTFLAAYPSMAAACAAVAALIARGLEPAALEILDKLCIDAVEASVYAAGYPREAAAVLLVELDGSRAEVDAASADAAAICGAHGALSLQEARDPETRAKLWKGRKGAFGAMGRIDTDLLVMDGVVPRRKLEWILAEIDRVRLEHGVVLSNVFHAGDGNLHPNISYDGRDPEQVRRVLAAGAAILELCVRAGGSLTGEHGIGVEKREFMPLLFDAVDLDIMQRVHDAWNPSGLCNPGKVFPSTRRCVEARGGSLVLPEVGA